LDPASASSTSFPFQPPNTIKKGFPNCIPKIVVVVAAAVVIVMVVVVAAAV
jgi:hypothetical protein